MNDIAVIYVVFSSKEQAQSIGKEAVLKGLAGCVNIFGNGSSFYMWEGHLQQDLECVAFFKTTKAKEIELIDFIHQVHTYDIPCVISFNGQTTDSFLSFLKQ